MRTTKELLILLDREIDGNYFLTGLCNLLANLLESDIIDAFEYHRLNRYIYYNNPVTIGMDSWDNKKLSESLYWWPEEEKEPRHEYLQILIKNCDEK